MLFRYMYQINRVIFMSGLETSSCPSQTKTMLCPNFKAEKLQHSLLAVAAETTHITATAKWNRVMTYPTDALPNTLAYW